LLLSLLAALPVFQLFAAFSSLFFGFFVFEMKASFIEKLYQMLSDALSFDYVRWSDNGDSFVIPDVDAFSRVVLPKFYKHSNFSSFVRQLHLYGFHKQTVGSYVVISHHLFLRDREDKLEEIVKMRIKKQNGKKDEVDALRAQLEELKEENRTLMEKYSKLESQMTYYKDGTTSDSVVSSPYTEAFTPVPEPVEAPVKLEDEMMAASMGMDWSTPLPAEGSAVGILPPYDLLGMHFSVPTLTRASSLNGFSGFVKDELDPASVFAPALAPEPSGFGGFGSMLDVAPASDPFYSFGY
jgi:hypothetical protein